jgi:3-hydroxyacyl-[acyl-carrier-protein] dehydratase
VSWRLVDRLLACEPGRSAVAEKRFSPATPLFADHFPGLPLVPGVLQIEMIAATGGKALRLAAADKLPLVAAVKAAKFYRPVEPGERCLIRVEITQLHAGRAAAQGVVEVEGRRAAAATVLYALIAAPEEARRDPVLEEWVARQAGSESGAGLGHPAAGPEAPGRRGRLRGTGR